MTDDTSFTKTEEQEMEQTEQTDVSAPLRDRVTGVLRAVLPKDRWQLLFLAAVVCFTVAPRVSTMPARDRPYAGWLLGFPANGRTEDLAKLNLVFISSRIMIGIGAVFGWFNAFFPGRRPVFRILWSMVLPLCAGLVAETGAYLYFAGVISPSVLTPHPWTSLTGAIIWQTMRELGPGFRMAGAGLALLVVFLSRAVFGIATLPLSLAEPNGAANWAERSAQRSRFLLALRIGPAVTIAFGLLLLPFTWRTGGIPVPMSLFFFLFLGVLPFVLNAVVLGAGKYVPVFRIARPFCWGYAGFGVALVGMVHFAAGLLGYALARSEWAVTGFGKFEPPSFWEGVHFPGWTVLSFILPAIAEESLFRGIFQKRFIGSYGVWRGVFFAQLTWGASHFYSDTYSHMEYAAIAIAVSSRVALCLAWGFVLAWLTLKSGTIWPAAGAHLVHNALLSIGFASQVAGKAVIFALAYGILAIWLYKARPVTVEDVEASPPMARGMEMVEVGAAGA